MRTKLTESIIIEISKRLKVGCYAKRAAEALRIAQSTYYYWLERGEKAKKLSELRKKVPKKEKIYLELLESVKQSDAEGEIALTTMMFSQAQEDWRAALAIMSRKYPERWAKKEYLDFKGTIDQGPNKREEAINEYETMFKGVPRAELATIIREMTGKIRDAKNKFLQEKDLKNKKLQAGLNQ